MRINVACSSMPPFEEYCAEIRDLWDTHWLTNNGEKALKLEAALMKVLDGINHSGKGKVWFAGRGIAPEWQMKREMLSPRYTTRYSDLLKVT